MPFRNGEANICQAIDLFLKQTYGDFELLIWAAATGMWRRPVGSGSALMIVRDYPVGE